MIVEGGKRPKCDEKCHISTSFRFLVNSKTGSVGLLLVGAGVAVNFVLVYINNLPPSWFYSFPDADQKNYYFGKYLIKAWTHLTVFTIGLFAGHLSRSAIESTKIGNLGKATIQPSPSISHGNRQEQASSTSSTSLDPQEEQNAGGFKRKSLLRSSSQLAAFVCMAAIIFSTYSWSTKEAPSPLEAALYDSLSRLLWSVALVGLMIQLCVHDQRTNQYSTTARLLSHPSCIFLGRLSFLAYLISPYVHTVVLAVEEQSLFPSLFLIFHVIVGNIVITYIMAFILAIVIEQPIRILIGRLVSIS